MNPALLIHTQNKTPAQNTEDGGITNNWEEPHVENATRELDKTNEDTRKQRKRKLFAKRKLEFKTPQKQAQHEEKKSQHKQQHKEQELTLTKRKEKHMEKSTAHPTNPAHNQRQKQKPPSPTISP